MKALHCGFAPLCCVLCSGFLLGSSCVIPVPDGDESVLTGDWQTTDETGDPVIVRFDDNGVVEAILVTADDGETVTILVDGASTTLDGSDVTVVVPTPAGDATFAGTLSDDQNTLTGTVDRTINAGDAITVIVPQGEITLTRVTEPEPDDSDGDGV